MNASGGVAALRPVSRAFSRAAATYESAAVLQRAVAERLAARVARLDLPPRPLVLEIGCGTGLLLRALARRLPAARFVVTDLSPAMVATCRASFVGDATFAAMDGALPALRGGFDLVVSSLALQWFAEPADAAARLLALVTDRGWLAVTTFADGTLAEWQAALGTAALPYPRLAALAAPFPPRTIPEITTETFVTPHADGLAFLQGLRAIGADAAPGRATLNAGALRRALTRFEAQGAPTATWNVASILARKGAAAAGVFVAGTDTGVGKTLVAAWLSRALGADYWKPVQTGLATEAGDSETVAVLAGLPRDRIHPPRHCFAAPLSPEAAAGLEDQRIDIGDFALPAAARPLVVEGAGGVLVPLAGDLCSTDLMRRLGLPVVLVARSTLGTINHTLLALEALRRRGIAVRGVVLNGPFNDGNRAAIERHGETSVLAEIPWLDHPHVDAVDRASRGPGIAALRELLLAAPA